MRTTAVPLIVGVFGILVILYGYFEAKRRASSAPKLPQSGAAPMRRDWRTTLIGAIILTASLVGGWLTLPL